ncbi:MAG TPA: His/Gly/Thr/Pro-type tRNA ligase C-terminal domain-containing protein, partial [Methanomicrobiales archaeon]|nr:His/Gly/Thr/Pro-type tRNA ligase C-terminal domain-containing protein [Methanomicrobiales archaeon]
IGLKRLRAFTMPDMHTLCRDMDQALQSFEEQLKIGYQTGEDLEIPYVSAFRCTQDFYETYEEWVKKIARDIGEPILLEILSDRVHYWVAKIDLAAIDAQGRPIENPTVQIDVESSYRFDIKYYLDGKEIHPPILHCSPTGSIERVICALLENAGGQKVPTLPTWLSPTQVRLIAVADRHAPMVEEIAEELNRACIRADIDNRDESVNRKVRGAGMDWVPYVAVIGDREAETGTLTVTVRRLSDAGKPCKVEMTVDELIATIRKETQGMPYRPLYTPMKLADKPRFI